MKRVSTCIKFIAHREDQAKVFSGAGQVDGFYVILL